MMQESEQDDEQILFDQEGLLLANPDSTSPSVTHRVSWCGKFVKTVVLCGAFFGLGLCIAIPGPTLLDLGERVNASTDQISLIFTARSFGYLLGSIIGGFLFDRFDQQLLLFYTLVFTSLATAVAPWCTALMILAIMIGFQGISMGVLDTGGNVFCIKIWGKKSAPYMQLLHFAFGVGAFIAPLLARPFLVNHELLSAYNNTSTLTNTYIGKGPMLMINPSTNSGNQRLIRAVSDEVNVTSSSVEFINGTLEADNNSTSVSHSMNDTVPTKVIAKKPSVTSEIHSSNADADGTDAEKKLRENEKKKNAGGGEMDDKEPQKPPDDIKPATVKPDSSVLQNNTNITSSDNMTSYSSNVSSTPLMSSTTTTSTTTTTTLSTTTTTTATTTTTSATTTTQATTTVAKGGKSTSQVPKSSTEIVQTTTFNSSSDSNVTITNTNTKKPGTTTGDFLNSAISALTNMSKIQFAYLTIGLLLCINAFLFLILYCKEKHRDLHSSQEEEENNLRRGTKSFRITILTLLFLFFFIYVGMEVTYGGLLSTFAFDKMGWEEQKGAMVTAVFWGSVAVGRGIAIFIAKGCSPPCMLVTDLILVVLGAVILCFGIQKYDILLWLGTLILGLGMSSIFPTGISWADHYFPLTGKATAVLIVGSALGEMIIPVVTSYLYEDIMKMSLMYVMFALSILSVVIYMIMQKVASSKRPIAAVRNGFVPLKEDDDVPLDLLEPNYANGIAETTRNRQTKVKFKPENNGEYKRLIDFDDAEFS